MSCITGALSVAKNEQKDRVRVTGTPVRVGHVVRDVSRAPVVRQAGHCRFPRVRRIQAGRCRLVVGQPPTTAAVVVRGLRGAPVAGQTARIGHDGRGTGPRRHCVRPAGRDPRGLAARGRGHRQEAFARWRRRSVSIFYNFFARNENAVSVSNVRFVRTVWLGEFTSGV